MELFRPDSPISTREEDRFQRYQFSKRIADIAVTGKYPKSLVIGVYGKWGEGKTSVLNCVETEIGERALVIRFNPWFFTDQSQLLKAFFVEIALALGKKMTKKISVITKAVSEYGESVSSVMEYTPVPSLLTKAFKTVGDLSKKIHDKVGADTIYSQKKRVDDLIVESGANLLVIIDDIDRLDAAETQMVFKLVKLVGDFPRTTYLLAFDDEIVASALAPQFGKSSDSMPGHTFLEKIIQMPLHLPKASDVSLRAYAFKLLNDTLSQINFKLSPAESEDFIYKFDTAFMPALVNPRVAVRFANDVGFTLPLLKDEVNVSDLMIIEAIKIFYPSLHYFIKQNPSYFFKNKPSIMDLLAAPKSNDSSAKDAIERELEKYNNLKDKIREMLWELFPQLQGFYKNINYGGANYNQWYSDKRICSPHYFYKYFSFTVDQKDISDAYFEEFMSAFESGDLATLTTDMKGLLSKTSTDTLLYKIRSVLDKLPLKALSNLGFVLSMAGAAFEKSSIFSGQSYRDEVRKIILSINIKLREYVKVIDYAKLILSHAEPMEFCVELYKEYRYQILSKEFNGTLTDSGISDLQQIVASRFEIAIEQGVPFETLGDYALVGIFNIYSERGSTARITELLTNKLNSDKAFSLDILKIFIPTAREAGSEETFKSNFDLTVFGEVLNFIDGRLLYESTVSAFGKINVKNDDYPFSRLSDEDIIGIYQRMYIEKFSADLTMEKG